MSSAEEQQQVLDKALSIAGIRMGDVVWAKYSSYPWWPGETHTDTQIYRNRYMHKDIQIHRHIDTPTHRYTDTAIQTHTNTLTQTGTQELPQPDTHHQL